ncbi:hypothetical protein EWB00_008481, partial [Schistosoma japonicum]
EYVTMLNIPFKIICVALVISAFSLSLMECAQKKCRSLQNCLKYCQNKYPISVLGWSGLHSSVDTLNRKNCDEWCKKHCPKR